MVKLQVSANNAHIVFSNKETITNSNKAQQIQSAFVICTANQVTLASLLFKHWIFILEANKMCPTGRKKPASTMAGNSLDACFCALFSYLYPS
jgi:hypothetical protein